MMCYIFSRLKGKGGKDEDEGGGGLSLNYSSHLESFLEPSHFVECACFFDLFLLLSISLQHSDGWYFRLRQAYMNVLLSDFQEIRTVGTKVDDRNTVVGVSLAILRPCFRYDCDTIICIVIR